MRDSGLERPGRKPPRRAVIGDYWTKDCVEAQVLLKPTAPDKAAGMFAVRVLSFPCALKSSIQEHFYNLNDSFGLYGDQKNAATAPFRTILFVKVKYLLRKK